MLERTLVLLKPSTVERALIGEIINRFEKKGLRIAGMKMLQLDDDILAEHYSHLKNKPFFGILKASMMKTPVVAMCLADSLLPDYYFFQTCNLRYGVCRP